MSEEMKVNNLVDNNEVKEVEPVTSGTKPIDHVELDKRLYDLRNQMLEAMSYIHLLQNRKTHTDYHLQMLAYWLGSTIDNLNTAIMDNLREWLTEIEVGFPKIEDYTY